MDKTKIKQNHEKLDKKFFEALIDEATDRDGKNWSTAYKVKGVKDKRGWYTKLVLIANGDCWTSRLRNKPLISLENFDGNVVLKFFDEKKKIEMPLCTLADLKTLLMVFPKFDNGLSSNRKVYVKKSSKKKSKNAKA